MTEPLWWRLSAGRRFAQGLADLRFEKGPRFLFVGETMIRHASPSRAITATSGGVHGATTWSCLIAPPSFLLIVAAGFLRAGSDAVDMTSITPATDKNLRAAASAQKHSARHFIDTCGSASRALRITALCIYQFWQYSALRPLVYLFTTRRPPQGWNSKERSTGSPIPPRFSFPANSIDPTAVDISSPLRLTPSIRGSSQPATPGDRGGSPWRPRPGPRLPRASGAPGSEARR
jgi:hypothetical protein